MQRKPAFPVANCSIKMPDASTPELTSSEEECEPPQRRQKLINFAHSQWGFNNWSWSVSKQDLDFVDCVGGRCTAGVAAFVLVSVKSFDIHRENVGYATSLGPNKGSAIHRARKCAVTNALRETLLSFGGSVATELMELLETNKMEAVVPPLPPPTVEPLIENNQNIANKQEPKNSTVNKPIGCSDSGSSKIRHVAPSAIKNVVLNPVPPVAKAQPMPANLPPAANLARMPRPPVPQPQMRPNSNEPSATDVSEEEARAERKRRQRLAQEEFRLKQIVKQKSGPDEQTLTKDSSALDNLLMAIPTQGLVVEETAAIVVGKRKSPDRHQLGASSKRRGGITNESDDIHN